LNNPNVDNELKNKIKKRIEAKNINIETRHQYSDEECKLLNINIIYYLVNDIEYENLKFSDYNLRIGYPNSFEIEAGNEMSKYIEVLYPNSLVYVGFATHSNDITVHLLKYVSNDQEQQTTQPSINDGDDEDLDKEKEKSNNDDEAMELTDKGHFVEILKIERIDPSMTPVKVINIPFLLYIKNFR
jgi:hypothetical protein